jgi:hypothetical protein
MLWTHGTARGLEAVGERLAVAVEVAHQTGGLGGPAGLVLLLTPTGRLPSLRRRVQQAVDRRFNRRRHDAARLIEAFGVRLRDQVDLDALHTELLAVVDQTIQPTRASLWLRPPGRSGGA